MNKHEEHLRDPNVTPEEIEADIGETRSAISEELRAIGEKLSPEHLKQEAKEKVMEVKEAAVGKVREAKERAMGRVRGYKDSAVQSVSHAGHVTGGYVRSNAVPLSLIAVGLGWLIASNRKHRARGDWMGPQRPYRTFRADDYGEYVYGTDLEAGDYGLGADYERDYAEGEMAESDMRPGEMLAGDAKAAEWREGRAEGPRQGRMHDVKKNVRDTAQHAKRRVKERTHQLAESAEQRFWSGKQRARDFGHKAGERIRQGGTRGREFALDNPLAVGAAALAAGVGVGLLLPSTRKEDQLLGRQRDRLIGEAREGMEELGRGLKETTREVKSAVRDAGTTTTGTPRTY